MKPSEQIIKTEEIIRVFAESAMRGEVTWDDFFRYCKEFL